MFCCVKSAPGKLTWHTTSAGFPTDSLPSCCCRIFFFSPCKRLRMAAHPQSATEEFLLSGRATATRLTKSCSWRTVCCFGSGIWSSSLCPPTPVQTTTLRRVPTTLTLRWLLRGRRLSCPKPRSSLSSSTQRTEPTLGTRLVPGRNQPQKPDFISVLVF